MSKVDLWNRAVDAMRQDEDERWHAVADWLRSEAMVQAELEPAVELFNVAIEQASGVRSYIRLSRKPDGEPDLFLDTNEGATLVALNYLGETPPDLPTDRAPERGQA